LSDLFHHRSQRTRRYRTRRMGCLDLRLEIRLARTDWRWVDGRPNSVAECLRPYLLLAHRSWHRVGATHPRGSNPAGGCSARSPILKGENHLSADDAKLVKEIVRGQDGPASRIAGGFNDEPTSALSDPTPRQPPSASTDAGKSPRPRGSKRGRGICCAGGSTEADH
jgi:hypothetical protein